MNIIKYLLENKSNSPNKAALVLDERELTYAELVEETRKVAAALQKIGVKKEKRIALLLNNSIEFVTIIFAAADLGATVVPVSSDIGTQDFLTTLESTDIDFVIGWFAALSEKFKFSESPIPVQLENCIAVGGTVDGCKRFEDFINTSTHDYDLGAQKIEVENDYILTMTSGSTSSPKPIVFTQGTKIRRAFNAQNVYHLTENDVILLATPMYHSISQRLIFISLLLGGTLVIMTRFTPRKWLSIIESQKVTFTIAVSTQLEAALPLLEKKTTNLSNLHGIVSCCSLLKKETKVRLIEVLNCDFNECYGVSEMGVITNLVSTKSDAYFHTVGKPVLGVEIKIVDENCHPVSRGVIGEIICKSEMGFSRYYKNPTITKKSMINGFFRTGDLGYLDEEGFLIFTGRIKEIIISGGTNIYPKDVESVLSTHPKVEQCVVIGVEDHRFGEGILAIVIPKLGKTINEREMKAHCLNKLADYQQPLAYEIVQDFPRTELGKVIKYKLVQQFKNYDLSAKLRGMLR